MTSGSVRTYASPTRAATRPASRRRRSSASSLRRCAPCQDRVRGRRGSAARTGCSSLRHRSSTPTSIARSCSCSSTATTARSDRPEPPERDRARGRVPRMAGVRSSPAVVFTGGPVSPDAVIALAGPGDARSEGWVQISATSAPSTSPGTPSTSACRSTRCGSSPAMRVGRPASSKPSSRKRVVRRRPPTRRPLRRLARHPVARGAKRQRGHPAMFAQYPDDVTAN